MSDSRRSNEQVASLENTIDGLYAFALAQRSAAIFHPRFSLASRP